MKRFLLMLALVATPAHASAGMDGDGNIFRPEWKRSEFTLTVHTYPDRRALNAAAETLHAKKPRSLMRATAFSRFALNASYCEIHILADELPAGKVENVPTRYTMDYDPSSSLKRTSWEHELMHCAFGRWHR